MSEERTPPRTPSRTSHIMVTPLSTPTKRRLPLRLLSTPVRRAISRHIYSLTNPNASLREPFIDELAPEYKQMASTIEESFLFLEDKSKLVGYKSKILFLGV